MLDEEACSFNDLPTELVVLVFSYLTPLELSRICARVCRYWWKTSYCPTLWRKLKLKISREEQLPSIRRLVERSRELESLKISMGHNMEPVTVIKSLSGIVRLRRLEIALRGNLVYILMYRIAETLPFVEEVVISDNGDVLPFPTFEQSVGIRPLCRLKGLRELTLRMRNGYVDNENINDLVKSCTSLRRLHIRAVDLTDDTVKTVLENLRSSLEHLRLQGTKLTDAAVEEIALCEKINSLSLANVPQLTEKSFEALRKCVHLKSLALRSVGDHHMFINNALSNFFKGIVTNIRTIDLHLENLGNYDVVISRMGKCCPFLQSLSLTVGTLGKGFSFINHFSPLKCFQLVIYGGIPSHQKFVEDAFRSPAMKSLTLLKFRGNFSDSLVETVALNCSRLRLLSLQFDRNAINEHSLELLVSHCVLLRQLDLRLNRSAASVLEKLPEHLRFLECLRVTASSLEDMELLKPTLAYVRQRMPALECTVTTNEQWEIE